MKKFIQKLLGFSAGPIIGAFISFFTVPVTTFFIVPEEFGKASMFTLVQSLVMTFIYLGVDQSFTREYNYFKDKKILLQNAILLPLFFSILMATIISLNSSWFSQLLFDSPNYGYLANLFSLMIIFSVFERFLLLTIRMEEKAVEYSFFNVFLKVVVFFTTIVLVFLGERSFLTIVYSAVFGQIIGDIVLILRNREFLKITNSYIDRDLIVKMLKFGLPLIIAASVNNLLNTSGRFFLRGLSTYHDLGIYTAAIKIANILQIFQSAFTSFWVPTAYRWNKENKKIKHFSYISDMVLLIMTLGFFFILFFKKYIVLILSSQYADAQYVAGLVALSPILYTLSETTTLGIVFSGRSYYNIWVSILSLIPSVCLNILLVPKFGTIGSAIATATAYMIFCFARTYFSRRGGFKINYKKQLYVTSIFYLAACINAIQSMYVPYITGVLLIVCLLFQLSTIKTTLVIKKNSSDWDFN
ncbi:MAG TPA: polysaccharide biosynthesis protein [Bavariicoccus seileri]|uniref:Polysaccharide biosynthesis protein n=1 Tax=Bavariicoccus seileri TaxID=549685 RepID=A0A3D4S5U1_9ENTE|nr:oligosaccharide flippase family protein [Bavariicoccus seileri]HCS93968.1 polysaccharide biosynthesis protein [Bavariicoccus seileri]